MFGDGSFWDEVGVLKDECVTARMSATDAVDGSFRGARKRLGIGCR